MTSDVEVHAAAPYGLVGLTISLVCILALAAVYAALIAGVGALADAALFGRSHLYADIQALRDMGGGSPSPFAYAALTTPYLALVAAVLSAARFRGGHDWLRLAALRQDGPWWRSRAYWALVATGIVYGIIASAVLSLYYPPSKDWVTLGSGFWSLIFSFILVVAAAPFGEEILFRGWIYTSLRSRFGAAVSIVVSALLFANAHYEPTHLYALAVFPVGLILGITRERTGTIWATATLHALYNFSGWLFLALGIG